MENVIGLILAEYDTTSPLHTQFKNKCESLVKELLDANGINVHETTARLKDRTSLEGKLGRISSQSKYSKLSDITDIVGLRVITYFNDEVDKVAEIIEKEFEIDIDNSIDKRASLETDRFGYLSLHYVARLSGERLKLMEYQRFTNCKFEIQLRSILQHTWAEIEHDLGYKSKGDVPKEIRRRFSRLAGLLELADDEFAGIRNDTNNFKEGVANKISISPDFVSIDAISLAAFARTSEQLKEITEEIGSVIGGRYATNEELQLDENRDIHGVSRMLGILEVHNIGQLSKLLAQYSGAIVRFARHYMNATPNTITNKPSRGLAFLCYILAVTNYEDVDPFTFVKRFLFQGSLNEEEEKQVKSLSGRIVQAYEASLKD